MQFSPINSDLITNIYNIRVLYHIYVIVNNITVIPSFTDFLCLGNQQQIKSVKRQGMSLVFSEGAFLIVTFIWYLIKLSLQQIKIEAN